MKLYELTQEFESLFESLDDMDGEDMEQAWFDTLESIEAEFDEKAENIAVFIKELTADIKAIKDEEHKQAERRRAKEHHVERLKAYLLGAMNATHRETIDGSRARVSVRSNAESPRFADEEKFVMWAIANADDLLTYPQPKISKTAVKDYIRAGGEIPGVTLERSQSVIIK